MPALRPAVFIVLFLPLLAAAPAFATCGNAVIEAGEECDDGAQNGGANSCCDLGCFLAAGERPDLIVSDLLELIRFGASGGITAYGVGSEACNLGSCWLRWFPNTRYHPLIGQNMFRLKDGRFEQIGQSWLKHGFGALDGDSCGACISPPNYNHLGVNCSDPYSAYNDQHTLGPRADVDPQTGSFPWPDPRINTTGNAIFKRLQVHDTDLDPAQNAGARYFLEVQYVSEDDPGTAHGDDNVSLREVSVGPAPYELSFVGVTERQPAIHAWKKVDAAVLETRVSAEGLFILSARAVPISPGRWRYTYALQNVTSHRSARSFSIPFAAGTTVFTTAFHDVDYHSGEPFDGTDWTPVTGATSVSWSTQAYEAAPLANALRWGTLYTFSFEADVPPSRGSAEVGFFRPGAVSSFLIPTVTPEVTCLGAANGAPCDDGNLCTTGETCASGACTAAQTVVCPGATYCQETPACDPDTGACSSMPRRDGEVCDDGTLCTTGDSCQAGTCVGASNPAPDEVAPALQVFLDAGTTVLYWSEVIGSTTYQVLRGSLADLPVGPGGGDEACVDPATQGSATIDPESPAAGSGFWYLVRGVNDCGPGPYGYRFENGAPTLPRESATCP